MVNRSTVAVVLAVSCVIGWLPWRVFAENATDAACQHPHQLQFPGTRWVELRAGERLGPHDALMTCQAGSVLIKATQPFGGLFDWEERDGWFWTTVPELTTAAVVPISDQPLQVEAITVLGPVFYSTDRAVIGASSVVGGQVSNDLTQLEEMRSRIRTDLGRMQWHQLAPGQLLGPWDLIWTGETGRVEIEILQQGPTNHADASTTVIDAWGRETAKRRFRSGTVFVMNPRSYVAARVTRTIGLVGLATDKEQVKAFLSTYPTGLAYLGTLDAQEHLRWLESLSKEQLE